ncbi:MAG: Serine-protein kinase RsbW [Chlamydiae bacterium]|nr:Serine-protein kinase RsbW [Chlamydiota bacterium]
MKKESTVTFCAELSSLYPMLEWVRSQLERSGLSESEIRRVEIALEEVFVNIISYAYQGESGMVEIGYLLNPGESIELTIQDRGLPFNPLTKVREVDPLATLEEREEGGLGIVFMKELMDSVEYTRVHETNILHLKKGL